MGVEEKESSVVVIKITVVGSHRGRFYKRTLSLDLDFYIRKHKYAYCLHWKLEMGQCTSIPLSRPLH